MKRILKTDDNIPGRAGIFPSFPRWPDTILAILSNVSQRGCFRAVLKQCGLILTQCGSERHFVLS